MGIVRARDDSCNNAERRCGARDGGAGWVGPPAPRRRLCVLRQIGDQLVAGLEQFLFVDDVVAVEDGAGLVAGQEHGDALGDTGADQVAGGGAAAIVEEAGRHPGRLAGGAPRRAPAADGDAVAVEDQRTVGVAPCPPPREGLGNGLRNGENPPHQRLRARGREPDDAPGLVDLLPGEAEDLVLAPAGVVGGRVGPAKRPISGPLSADYPVISRRSPGARPAPRARSRRQGRTRHPAPNSHA